MKDSINCPCLFHTMVALTVCLTTGSPVLLLATCTLPQIFQLQILSTGATPSNVRVKKMRRQPFLLLTLLTFAVGIFWTPTIVLHLAVVWFKFRDHNQNIQQATGILFALEPALDPILFTLAMADLRKSLANMMRTCTSKCRKSLAVAGSFLYC